MHLRLILTKILNLRFLDFDGKNGAFCEKALRFQTHRRGLLS